MQVRSCNDVSLTDKIVIIDSQSEPAVSRLFSPNRTEHFQYIFFLSWIFFVPLLHFITYEKTCVPAALPICKLQDICEFRESVKIYFVKFWFCIVKNKINLSMYHSAAFGRELFFFVTKSYFISLVTHFQLFWSL